jgi:hypothetical protein
MGTMETVASWVPDEDPANVREVNTNNGTTMDIAIGFERITPLKLSVLTYSPPNPTDK